MRGHVAKAAFLVESLQSGLHGGNVAQDTVLGQDGEHLAEGFEGIFYSCCIDNQFGLEGFYFAEFGEPEAVLHKAQTFGIDIVYRNFVLEAQYVGKERAHFSGSHN